MIRLLLSTAALLFVLCTSAGAHFGAIIPSSPLVTSDSGPSLKLAAKFIHPMEGHYMEMAGPRVFGVLHDGVKTDLLPTLSAARGKSADQEENFTYWVAGTTLKRPGDYTFYMEPAPYWEPAEDLFIVHYTKVCVNAYGLQQGWDEPVGLETEIVPMTRPYGLWSGNLFSGRVLRDGQPVPFAEIEVEFINDGAVSPPNDAFITQVIKADANGTFSYAMPRAGWWGFSALSLADWTLEHEGEQKGVEIGAVYWVHTRDMK